MPLPAGLARFNKQVTNRVARTFAGRLPGFAVLVHRGRRSGRVYRTPVNMFRAGNDVVLALTYGRDRDWVKNVLAANGCEVETRGVVMKVIEPRIADDPDCSAAPAAIRPFLKALGVREFMHLTARSGY